MKRDSVAALSTVLTVLLFLSSTPLWAAPCEALSGLALDDTIIASASVVPPGVFSAPANSIGAKSGPIQVPAFCRVVGKIRPSINFEVWLPSVKWNGKFQAVGGGGFAGSISYGAMGDALRDGYATASTDTGHSGGGGTARWALGNPELVVDFGHRAIHEMTVKAKLIIAGFYGTPPKRSYFDGCSRGGFQGIVEAQRYPMDYDGIVAGAPAIYASRYNVSQLWIANATVKDPDSFILPPKYELLNTAVLSQCDGLDGVKDGLLEDPRRCTFDPKVLLCNGPDNGTCLTQKQVAAVQKIYSPPTNPRTKMELHPPLERGGESGWPVIAGGPAPSLLATEFFKFFVWEDSNWDWKTFDFDWDVETTDKKVSSLLNITSPDLRTFAAHGKMILYHGWNDQRMAPRATINYYQSIVRSLGESQTNRFLRLFMVPGMQHCGGGPGPNVFDAVSALDKWVDHGTAPTQIVASRPTSDATKRTRPLCPYPLVARYKGAGSIDDANQFLCVRRD